jgi:hypothetical protein
MQIGTIIKSLLVVGFVTGLGFELGLFQRMFDSRSIVEDGVIGCDYWIVEVDGQPTDRIPHGYLITNIPFALVEQGNRVIELAATSHPAEDTKTINFHPTVEKGVNYRISKNTAGNPELIAIK